jgi:hypothetical protein
VRRDSSVDIATGYGLEDPGIEFRWGDIFHTRPGRHWGAPGLLHKGYRVSSPGGKAAGGWRYSHTPSSAEDKERVELYLYFFSGLSWSVLDWTINLREWGNYRELFNSLLDPVRVPGTGERRTKVLVWRGVCHFVLSALGKTQVVKGRVLRGVPWALAAESIRCSAPKKKKRRTKY